jgi:hypothetical protein
MSDKPKDGIYTFKAGETLPDWCSFAPGAKIERGSVKCRVVNGTAGEWEISDDTRIEGDYYLYGKGNKVGKIHIKEKRRITKEAKPRPKRFNNIIIIGIFLLFLLLIFLINFIINNS